VARGVSWDSLRHFSARVLQIAARNVVESNTPAEAMHEPTPSLCHVALFTRR
jgi:hypothetical protein